MQSIAAVWREFRADASRLTWSCIWFFLVLFSYYCIKPLRDALGTNLSRELGSLYLGTFLTTLVALGIYSWLVSRMSRRRLLLSVHLFFGGCLVAFYFAIPNIEHCPPAMTAVFFVWVSVFNLYVVTLFWSAMADLFNEDEAKKWFGLMAAAGSIGSVTGSYVAGLIARVADARQLLILSAVALGLAVVAGWQLIRRRRKPASPLPQLASRDQGTGGSIFAGLTHVLRSRYLIGICLFVVFGKFAATFIYNLLQLQLLAEVPNAKARTELFSQIGFYSQIGSFVLQGFAAGFIIRFLGMGVALMLPCAAFAILYSWLFVAPTLTTLSIAHAAQQIVSYGILVPAQHVLFTVVSREDKYKAKGFIDTVVFRASDVAAANVCDQLMKWGATVSRLSAAMIPVAAVWIFLGWMLSREFRQQASDSPSVKHDQK